MILRRRGLIAAGLVVPSLALPRLALGQSWPGQALRLVVPFPAGGSNDILARILQPRLAALLGTAVQVENRAGRDGSAGAIETLRAPPDGNSWLLSFDSEATNASLYDLPYQLLRDFIPAGRIATGPLVIAASATLPWRSLTDLAIVARGRVVDYATNGRGGIPHLAMLATAEALGLRLGQTTYRGGRAAFEDVAGGFVPLLVSNLPVMGAGLRAGVLRPLAVTTAEESRRLPGVKTLAAQGVPGFEAGTWWVLLGHAQAPAAARTRMAQALATVLAEPEVVRRIEEQGVDVAPLGPAETAAFLAVEIERWGAMIRRHGLR